MKQKKKAMRLRTKLYIIMSVIAIVPTILVSLLIVNSASKKEVENTTSEMQGQVLILANQLTTDDYFTHATDSEMNAVIQQIADIWGGRIQVMNESGKIIVDTYHVDTGRYNVSDYFLSALSGMTVNELDKDSKMVALAQPVYSATDKTLAKPIEQLEDDEEPTYVQKIDGVVLVTVDMTSHISTLFALQGKMALVILAVAVFVVLLTVLVLYMLFKPFNKLADEIDQAAEGTLRRVNIRNHFETIRIGDGINRTLRRLYALTDSRQEFVSNASHELKTPITSMRVLADSINSMDDVSVETYKEFMEDISAELDREGRIIDDLLSMSRLEEGVSSLNISEINLNDWMEQALRRVGPIAKAEGVEISFESFRPVSAKVDEIKLTLAITNIVENAIKYNKEGGFIKISLNADYHYFYIKIEDSGIGIPREAIPHLFDRFYRVEKDRSRESGGTGLGLSISKQIINLHHGVIRVHSELGEGTIFAIRIPLEYKEDEKIEEDSDEEPDDSEK